MKLMEDMLKNNDFAGLAVLCEQEELEVSREWVINPSAFSPLYPAILPLFLLLPHHFTPRSTD
jgi:hypothetical protein